MLSRQAILCLTILLVSAFIAARSIGTAAPPAEHKTPTFLEQVKPAQIVALTEKDGRYEIGIFDEAYQPLRYKVIEIGPDFIRFRDVVGVTDLILPIYALKGIKIIHLPAR